MNQNLMVKLQHFFEVDLRIKREMYNIAPQSKEGYIDENTVLKYTDELNDSLNYIFSELKCVIVDLWGSESLAFKKVIELEKTIKNEFYSCGLDMNKLTLFYRNRISDMNLDFINLVKKNCVGYSMHSYGVIEQSNTINEILHFLHSYILNNEYILQALPELNKKINEYNYPITLRGTPSILFEKLFEQFPTNIDVGWTDMVTINEKKLLMMIRDRGHALTIEITLSGNIARVEYFIPKLCNIDMINSLPGINKVNQDSVGATGVFEKDINELPNALFDFIAHVPTDLDMVLPKYNR